MKKIFMAVLVLAVGFAFNTYAADQIEVKSKTEIDKGKTTTETVVKDKTTGGKAKETTVTEGGTTTTKTELKGKTGEVKKETVDTATGETGKVKGEYKNGAIKEFEIDWKMSEVTTTSGGKNYITEYTIKGKANKELVKELNLTPEQIALVKPGTYTITSTSPFTSEDIRSNMRAVILKDIKSAIEKTQAPKK